MANTGGKMERKILQFRKNLVNSETVNNFFIPKTHRKFQ